jgi:protein-S-isoprenylcysteine O-methyltransferase Ste14
VTFTEDSNQAPSISHLTTVVLLPTTAAILYRIHVGEAALLGAFGADYRAYSQTTKRLIPGIY